MREKFKTQRGESLIETIASVLVVAVGMAFLANAIVTTVRLNHTASSSALLVIPDRVHAVVEAGEWKVSVHVEESAKGIADSVIPVTVYSSREESISNENRILYYYDWRNPDS